MPLQQLRQLRRRLRQSRRVIPSALRRQLNREIQQRLSALPQLLRAKRVALYLANDGEVDLSLWMAKLQRCGTQVLLPVLYFNGERRLLFAPYQSGDQLILNRFGILEPDLEQHPPLPLGDIDAVILPLVGFDARCHRLGMGGGYYDRTFASVRLWRKSRPNLIGVAYECQRIVRIRRRSWDISPQRVVTEAVTYRLGKKLSTGPVDRL